MADGVLHIASRGFGAVIAGGVDAGFVDGVDEEFLAIPFITNDERYFGAAWIILDVGYEKSILNNEIGIAVAEEVGGGLGVDFGGFQFLNLAVGIAAENGVNVRATRARHAGCSNDDGFLVAVAFEVVIVETAKVWELVRWAFVISI